MDKQRGGLAVLLLAMVGMGAGWLLHSPAASTAVPVMAQAPAENLFALATPAPTPTSPGGFSIEVLNVQTQQPRKRVLIYHSHTYEAYEPAPGEAYQETERWRTADSAHNVVRVGEELAALLRGMGFDVVHDVTAFEPPNLSSAYARSLEMLERRLSAGERYDLYIDLHRDAYVASQTGPNTVPVGGTELARLMLLIGRGDGQTGQGFDKKPDWQSNLRVAEAITDQLNAQAEGLCREVRVRSGRFNQHISDACVLVEAGNNRNTLDEVLASMPYLADAVTAVLTERQE